MPSTRVTGYEKRQYCFLLVGPRGSGKTEYLKRIMLVQPEISAISRDEIFIRIFGSVHLDPYSQSPHYAFSVVSRLLRRKLSTQKNSKVILEYWTGASRDRQRLVAELRKCGASKVVALYFITPVELVQEWFWKKPGVAKVSEMKKPQPEGTVFFNESTPSREHELFHHFAQAIASDGFDQVIRINPLDPLIVL